MSLFGRRRPQEQQLEERLLASWESARDVNAWPSPEPLLDELGVGWSRVEEVADSWRLESGLAETFLTAIPEGGVAQVWRNLASAGDAPAGMFGELLHANAQGEGAAFGLQQMRSDRYVMARALAPLETLSAPTLGFALHSFLERTRWFESRFHEEEAPSNEPLGIEQALLEAQAAARPDMAAECARLETSLTELELRWDRLERLEDSAGWGVSTDLGGLQLRQRPDGGAFGAWLTLGLLDQPLEEEMHDWMLDASALEPASFALAEGLDGQTTVEVSSRLAAPGLTSASLALWLESVVRLARWWV